MSTSIRLQSGLVIKVECADCGADDCIAPLFSDEWLGTAVWPAARVLVHFLEQHQVCLLFTTTNPLCCQVLTPQLHQATLHLSSLSIVELGSGTGVCGLAAAGLGATRVTLTDKCALLETLAHNIRLNSLGSSVECRELTWSTAPLPHHVFHDGADLVLMSDCLNSVYGDQHALALAYTLRCLLQRRLQLLPGHATSASPMGLLSQAQRGSGQAEHTFFSECARIGLVAELVATSYEPTDAVYSGGSMNSHSASDVCLVGEQAHDDSAVMVSLYTVKLKP
jgi:hypothetical protein